MAEKNQIFKRIIVNNKPRTLYYHRTNGGAEYLTDAYVLCPNGDKEATFESAHVILRVDGNELEIIKLPNTEA